MDERSKYLRRLIIRGMRSGKRGHWGSSASLVEILRVLYDEIKQPEDKIILSKGHGCLALYAILADKGIIPIEELDRFCHKDGMLGGHPSPHIPGVLCHTGSLGHGLGIGVGMAIAAKIRKQNHQIYVICGDGEIQEGSIWEAVLSASKHSLNNLHLIIDCNGLQSAGTTSSIAFGNIGGMAYSLEENLRLLFTKWGWMGCGFDGHNIAKIKEYLINGRTRTNNELDRPICYIANTVKGKGISYLESNTEKHYLSRLTDEDFSKMEAAIG